MSIYSSYFDIGYDHKNSCARIKRVGRREYEQNDAKPCTCGSAPLKYQGSHVLPSRKDKRDGCIGFARIPEHITRNGRHNGNRPHPYIRFHLNSESVVLTRKHAKQLRDAMTEWLNQFEGEVTK